MRIGRSVAAGDACAGGSADAGVATAGVAAVAVLAEGEAADPEPPDWRALIAMTRSLLRILAVPVRPKPPARP